MAFITSDSLKAAEQMSVTLGHPYALITPQGCHIELEPSPECHMFTVAYWFALSLSDVIITQVTNNLHPVIPIVVFHILQVLPDTALPEPSSGFSKYAGIYGLKPNPFRIGKDCGRIVPTKESGVVHSGNWWCLRPDVRSNLGRVTAPQQKAPPRPKAGSNQVRSGQIRSDHGQGLLDRINM